MKLRGLKQSDENFILATMLNGIASSIPFKFMIREEFMKAYQPIVKQLLSQSDVRIACLNAEPGDEDIIIGYIVFKNDVLNYAYCKKAWRQKGVYSQLSEGLKFSYLTTYTESAKILMEKYGFKYNPFL